MTIKKITSILCAAVVMCAAFVGCSAEKGAVSTDGSTSMEKVIGVLGETFEADTGITVTYNPTGSGSGIKAVAAGSCLKPTKAARERSF